MSQRLNPSWTGMMLDKIRGDGAIDEVLSANLASAWLITVLTKHGTMFKVYNLGGGVKRITTNTDTCPCCKRKL